MTRVRLDRLVVFDVEETCWEDGPPEGQRTEIVEIGAAELLLDGEPRVGRTLSLAVRPVASRVSPYCTALTGITPEDARRGRPLREALATLRKEFGGPAKTWAAWGRDDLSIARDCAALGIDPPEMGGFVDLGALWGMLSGAPRAAGLRSALAGLGLEFEGTPHRALDDAVNTARVAAGLAGVLRPALAPAPGTPRPA